MAVELADPRRALEVVPRDLRLPCCDRWRVNVVVVVQLGALVLTSPSGDAPLRPICFMSSKASPALRRSKRRSGMILFSTRMFTSGRLRPWSAWVCSLFIRMENYQVFFADTQKDDISSDIGDGDSAWTRVVNSMALVSISGCRCACGEETRVLRNRGFDARQLAVDVKASLHHVHSFVHLLERGEG